MGKEYIPQDPHKMSSNGDVMAEIIDKNAMCVVNGLQEKCEGVIRRIRSTEDGNIERSAIDLVLVSADGGSIINGLPRLVYDWMHHQNMFCRGGAVKQWEKEKHSANEGIYTNSVFRATHLDYLG